MRLADACVRPRALSKLAAVYCVGGWPCKYLNRWTEWRLKVLDGGLHSSVTEYIAQPVLRELVPTCHIPQSRSGSKKREITSVLRDGEAKAPVLTYTLARRVARARDRMV
jgi:hypothetical protein